MYILLFSSSCFDVFFFLFGGDRQVPITSKQEKVIHHKMLKKLLGKSNMYKICTYYFFEVAASTYSFFLFAGDRQVPITSKQEKIIRHKMLKKPLGKTNMYKICTCTFFQVAVSTYSFFLFASDRHVPITSKQKKRIRHKILKKLLEKHNMYKFCTYYFFK